MDLTKKLLILLAIFCVIASATSVCAADVATDDVYSGMNYEDMKGISESQNQDDGGWAGSQYQDEGGWAGSQYQDEGGWAGSQYNETIENPQNATHVQSAGEPTNTTGNSTDSVAQNMTAANSHKLLSTGNPIIMLLGVTALIGGYAVLKRK